MKDKDYTFANDLEKFSVSTSWLPRLYGKMPWHFSRRGKIAYLESNLATIERKAAKYLGQKVNYRCIHQIDDEELRAAKLTFWGYLNELRSYGIEHRKLTGKTELSSPNYYQARNVVELGLLVIEGERDRREQIPDGQTAWWEEP